MAITTELELENYTLTDIDASFSDQISDWIDGVEMEMNMMTDRQLIADDTESTYYYDGTGKKRLMIDDFNTISAVETRIDNTDTDPTDITSNVYMFPANKKPVWRLDSYYPFPQGLQNILVTGKRGCFASDSIPRDLVFAATVLVAGIINYANTSKGEIKSESIGRYSVTYETDEQKADFNRAMKIIQSYRKIR